MLFIQSQLHPPYIISQDNLLGYVTRNIVIQYTMFTDAKELLGILAKLIPEVDEISTCARRQSHAAGEKSDWNSLEGKGGGERFGERGWTHGF